MEKILTLGESLLRLSASEGIRLEESKTLDVSFGGAEANVAVALARLGNQVSYATKLPNNYFSKKIMRQLKGYDVETEHIKMGGDRLGTYYLELGSGNRTSSVIYDRKYSAISQMQLLEWDLARLFADVTLFHTTGITLALSDKWLNFGLELIKAARDRGILVSFDMNYRQKLWTKEEAKKAYQAVLPYVDILSAGQLDAIHFMEIELGKDAGTQDYIEAIAKKYPQLRYITGTVRQTIDMRNYTLSAYLYNREKGEFTQGETQSVRNVIDRVGTGDAFAAGILHGITQQWEDIESVNFATTLTALNHTVKGDISLFEESDVKQAMRGAGNIQR